jgi:hypothetical protein
MKYLFLGVASVSVIGALSYLYTKKSNQKQVKQETEKKSTQSYSALNLTPHSINFYDGKKNLLFGIKPEKDIQLRLSCSKQADKVTDTEYIKVGSPHYDFDPKNNEKLKGTEYEVTVGENGKFVSGNIPVRNPVIYDTVDGIEKLREKLRGEKDCSYNSIIVSAMVAEFLSAHKQDYADLRVKVLVPDNDPKNAVRDEKGVIIGVKGLVEYGSLE